MKIKKQEIISAIFWLIASISFVLIGGYLVIVANGYKINFSNFSLQKTGLLYIKTEPQNVSVQINNKIRSKKTPYTLSQVLPGWYDIVLSKPEYQPWSRTVQIEGGYATRFGKIDLFLETPIIKKGNSDDIDTLNKVSLPTDLGFNDYDVYRIVDGVEVDVARLSQKVEAAYWYPDHYHVVYQADNEINICEIDGRDAHLLFKLDTADPAKIAFKDDGKVMLVSQNDKVYSVTIR